MFTCNRNHLDFVLMETKQWGKKQLWLKRCDHLKPYRHLKQGPYFRLIYFKWDNVSEIWGTTESHNMYRLFKSVFMHFLDSSVKSAADWTHDRESLSMSVRKPLLTASRGQQCGLDRTRGCSVSGDKLLWSVIHGKTRSQRFRLHTVSL